MSAGEQLNHDKQRTIGHRPRFSIDLSLELERQLENESQPSTPAYGDLVTPSTAPSVYSPQPQSADHRVESLDPQVLASIVTQLRQGLGDITKERDGLLDLIAKANVREAGLQDALQHMTDKSTSLKEKLQEAQTKQKDDEEAISMLRTKVEESRRGLMRLQTETRRMSTAPPVALDMNRGASFGGTSTTSKAAKRASFTPLTGSAMNFTAIQSAPRGHKASSSISESGMYSSNLTPGDIFDGRSPAPSPNGQLLFNDSASTSGHPPTTSRRFSGFFGGKVSSSPPKLDSNSFSSSYDPLAAELEALRRELQGVKDELDEAKIELSESTEAREASETCVQALREFIAENSVGVVPAASNQQQHQHRYSDTSSVSSSVRQSEDGESKKGWGFKLWNKDSNNGGVHSPIVTAPTPTSALPPVSAAPNTGIGRFFGRTPSVSSVGSLAPHPPAKQPTPSASVSPAPSISHSDEEDSVELMEEPISPSDIIGPAPAVRQSTSSSSSGVNFTALEEVNLGKGKDVVVAV